jgi:hypothetical protein
MTVPADGVPRLIHFVDTRLAQLQMTKTEAVRRGFPNASTLAKIRGRDHQQSPRVRTLLRIDRTLGWQPGSAAVVLLGGTPLTISTRTTRAVRTREATAQPLTPQDVVLRTLDTVRAEISRVREQADQLGQRIDRLAQAYDHLVEEFSVDPDLIDDYAGAEVAADSS